MQSPVPGQITVPTAQIFNLLLVVRSCRCLYFFSGFMILVFFDSICIQPMENSVSWQQYPCNKEACIKGAILLACFSPLTTNCTYSVVSSYLIRSLMVLRFS